MGKKLKKLAALTVGAGAAYAGITYLMYHEVMHRHAPIWNAVSPIAWKKMCEDSGAPMIDRPNDPRYEWFATAPFETYHLLNDDGQQLSARLYKADKPSDVYVFLSHGYRSSGPNEYSLISQFYHELGYNVFMVDHRASGDSEGEKIGYGYYESKDCMKWLNYLLVEFGADIRIVLHGISMGSATVMIMSAMPDLPDNVKFIVADCGYTSAWDEFVHNLENAHVPVHPLLDGANFWNRHFNGYDFRDANPLEAVKHAKVPILFIHGDVDDFVPTRMGKELYLACAAPYKDLLITHGADHAHSYDITPEPYEAKVKEFIEKFL